VDQGIPVFKNKRVAFVLLLILMAVLWGCGRKALPVAPESSVPEAVADLRAWVKEEGVYVSWSFPSRNKDGTRLDDLQGFRVLRQARPLSGASCPDCPLKFEMAGEIDLKFPREARIEGRRVWWQDSNLKWQNEYDYVVVAYNRYLTSGPESNRVKISFDQPPAAVANVRIKSEDRLLEVGWDFVPRLKSGESLSDPAGFNVYRKSEGMDFGFLPVNPEPVSQSPYRDGRLENGKRYEYVIRAVRNFKGTLIEGPGSAVATGVPEKTTPPSDPTGLIGVIRRDADKKGVELRWNRNPEPDVAGYDLYRQEKETDALIKLNSQDLTETYFFDATADPQKTYLYRLKAIDNSPRRNQSEFSQEAEVNP
jgi:hypothetical protein